MEGGNGMSQVIVPGSGGTNSAPCAVLGLEMPLHQHHPQQQQQQQLLSYPTQPREIDHHNPWQEMRYATTTTARGKQLPMPALSSEEEAPPSFGYEDTGGGEGTKRVAQMPSPWQRMKWTDSMVRLLIMVVYCVGDDGGMDGGGGGDLQHASGKGKKAATGVGQLQQKKGKWKSVSRAMMERGYCVSPQQCEDKFNDLNKRYKRVNDLLGKGTACRVVENQSLLDSMDHLSPKAKEEARKLLNSKHLFFREMCAYHNTNIPLPPAPAPDQSHQQQRHCLHQTLPHPLPSAAAAAAAAAVGGALGDPFDNELIATGDYNHEEDEEEDEEEEEDEDADNEVEGEDDYNDDSEEEDDDDENNHDDSNRHFHHRPKHQNNDKHEQRKGNGGEAAYMGAGGFSGAKRTRRVSLLPSTTSSASSPLSLSLSSPSSASGSLQQLRNELMGLAAAGSSVQQKQWLSSRVAELEEQRVELHSKAFQLERQRFKWLRFSSNKERELERTKLENERLRLDNERMLLFLRHKELELNSASEAASQDQLLQASADQSKRSADHHHQHQL